uniref:Uncharacterized protein n=1 Tax=Pristionchus pacificus TaxID=54126 RepID=A0A2A6B964_PRIPA|eukprot:PDM61738.1 hypothetical protein PRIPAC_51180 [Pristionchus pacificus]
MHLSTPISAPGSERAKITVQLDFSLKTIRLGRDGPRLSKIIPDLSTLLWRSAAMMFAERTKRTKYEEKLGPEIGVVVLLSVIFGEVEHWRVIRVTVGQLDHRVRSGWIGSGWIENRGSMDEDGYDHYS